VRFDPSNGEIGQGAHNKGTHRGYRANEDVLIDGETFLCQCSSLGRGYSERVTFLPQNLVGEQKS
jgi:hypothetical protein